MEFKIPIETEVVLPGYPSVTGILKFVGEVQGKAGTYAGVEILGDQLVGKNDGDVDGIQYFKTSKPRSGLFIPYMRLLKANIHLKTPVRTRHKLNGHSPTTQSFLPQLPTASPTTKSSPLTNMDSRSDSTVSPIVREDLERLNRRLIGQNRDLQLQLAKCNNEIKEKTSSLVELQQCLDELEKEISNKEHKLLKQKRNYDQQRDELRDAIRTLQQQLEENAQLYSEEIQRLTSGRGYERSLTEEHDKYVESTSQQLLQLKTEIIESNEALENKNKEIQDLKRTIKKIDADKVTAEKMVVDMEYQLESKNEKIKNLELAMTDLRTSNDSILSDKEKEITALRTLLETSQESDRSKEIEQLQSELGTSKLSLQAAEIDKDRLDYLELENEKLSLTIKELEDKNMSEISQINSQHSIDLQRKQDMIDSLSKKIVELDSQNAMRHLKDITNFSRPSASLSNELNFSSQHTLPVSLPARRLTPKRSAPILRKVASNITINENSISQLVDGELMVYIPETKLDPTVGREKWCGLCEKQGHDSVDCENF